MNSIGIKTMTMNDDYFTVKIPKFTGYKTIALNIVALGFGSYLLASAALNAGWHPLSINGAAVVCALAFANLILRIVTASPVLRKASDADADSGNEAVVVLCEEAPQPAPQPVARKYVPSAADMAATLKKPSAAERNREAQDRRAASAPYVAALATLGDEAQDAHDVGNKDNATAIQEYLDNMDYAPPASEGVGAVPRGHDIDDDGACSMARRFAHQAA
ncbi:MAG: hypothetical protein P8Y36_00615 [Alphaproteobacteria bacterium]